MLKGVIRCPVYPTEDYERLVTALSNLFPDMRCDRKEIGTREELILYFEDRASLGYLKQMIHDARILDAVRSRLEKNWNGMNTIIRLDKQVAFYGKVRLIDDSEEDPPLGYIELQIDIDNENFDDFINWMTPPTKDGRVISD